MSLKVHIKKKINNFTLDVNFETNGSTLGILGASGCGKSMTLQCIAGIQTPDEGFIQLNGRVLFDSKNHINRKPQERNVGYLFQNYALFPNMTVIKNMEIGLKGKKSSKKEKCLKMMEKLHLNGLENHYPSQLSGGQQQRVALARCLLSKPEVLLLDEPFSALDSYLKEELQEQLDTLLRFFEGESILVTHSREEAYKLCEDLMVMDNGKILELGKTKRIFSHPKKVQAAKLIGCSNVLKARKVSEDVIEALDLGIQFRVLPHIPNNLAYVGIQAHNFIPWNGLNKSSNKIPCKVVNISEAPNEWKVLFTPKEKKDNLLYWKINKSLVKDDIINFIPEYVMVDPESILMMEG